MSLTNYKQLLLPLIEATVHATLTQTGKSTQSASAMAELAVSDIEEALNKCEHGDPNVPDHIRALANIDEFFVQLKSDIKDELRMEMLVTTPKEPKSDCEIPKRKSTIEKTVQVDPLDALKNNPLFARVSKNIERANNGQSMYTADEIIEVRRDRFDPDHPDNAETLASFHSDYKKESTKKLDDETDAEHDQWERLLKDQIGLL